MDDRQHDYWIVVLLGALDALVGASYCSDIQDGSGAESPHTLSVTCLLCGQANVHLDQCAAYRAEQALADLPRAAQRQAEHYQELTQFAGQVDRWPATFGRDTVPLSTWEAMPEMEQRLRRAIERARDAASGALRRGQLLS